RTSVNAERTSSTVVLNTLAVVLEIEIEQQLTNEHPRSVLLRDHIRMLTQPTQPGAHCPRFVHHRLNIDTHFPLCTRLMLLDPRKQRYKLLFDDVVIIVAPRITRDFSCCRTLLVLVRRKVVERNNYD